MNTEILFYAFRYALGRSTYAVQTVADEVIEHWDLFSIHEQELIHFEIREAINRHAAGMDMDVRVWQRVLEQEVCDE